MNSNATRNNGGVKAALFFGLIVYDVSWTLPFTFPWKQNVIPGEVWLQASVLLPWLLGGVPVSSLAEAHERLGVLGRYLARLRRPVTTTEGRQTLSLVIKTVMRRYLMIQIILPDNLLIPGLRDQAWVQLLAAYLAWTDFALLWRAWHRVGALRRPNAHDV